MKAKRKKTYLHLPNRLLPGYNMERYLPRLRPPPLELFPYRKHRRSCQIATRPITKKIVKNKRKSVPNRLTKVLLNFGVQRSKFHQKTPPKKAPEQLRRTQESEVKAAEYLHELPTHDEIDNQTGAIPTDMSPSVPSYSNANIIDGQRNAMKENVRILNTYLLGKLSDEWIEHPDRLLYETVETWVNH